MHQFSESYSAANVLEITEVGCRCSFHALAMFLLYGVQDNDPFNKKRAIVLIKLFNNTYQTNLNIKTFQSVFLQEVDDIREQQLILGLVLKEYAQHHFPNSIHQDMQVSSEIFKCFGKVLGFNSVFYIETGSGYQIGKDLILPVCVSKEYPWFKIGVVFHRQSGHYNVILDNEKFVKGITPEFGTEMSHNLMVDEGATEKLKSQVKTIIDKRISILASYFSYKTKRHYPLFTFAASVNTGYAKSSVDVVTMNYGEKNPLLKKPKLEQKVVDSKGGCCCTIL